MLEPQLTCPAGVSYDDASHTYLLDGAPAPSVSALLQVVNPDQYAGISEDVMAKAAARGHRRHDIVALEVRGELDYGALTDDDIEGAYLPWLAFLEAIQFQPTHSERVVCSRVHRYCGTLDLAGTLVYKGVRDNWIVDLKFTAQRPVLVDVQTEAYKLAAVESIGFPLKGRRGCLWIHAGKYEFFELKDPGARATLLSARNIHHWRQCHE